jgi:dienelactone hydrolase
MRNKRREFIKLSGITWLGIAGGSPPDFSSISNHTNQPGPDSFTSNSFSDRGNKIEPGLSIIGQYGEWAAGLNENKLPAFSFRSNEWPDLEAWRKAAKKRVVERMAIPGMGKIPTVNVVKKYSYDGLQIEELNWQLPYGRPTEAILLKPVNAKGKLPAILAFHDHGGNKYFGTRKITKTSHQSHPLIEKHQADYYEGMAWANEIAKRGYVVLVTDAFPFASRRVMLQDVPDQLRRGLNDDDPENPANISAYNQWASDHEHIMAKSLYSSGTTWPGVFFAEDKVALDILCVREEVDATRIGCGGLSGGGMRTIFMGGLDPRIKCAVCVGFMTTWKDFILHKSFTHTWMTYVPLLPNELDLPELLGLRVPLPTLVMNDEEDDLFSLSEMKRADKIMSEVYKKAKAPDNYRCSFYPGPHKFDKKMQREAFDWFDRWLKN